MNANLSSGVLYRVAVVGAGTLKGRELKDVLEENNFPTTNVALLDDEESLGKLESVGDEASFIQSVTNADFTDYDIVFFASDREFTKQHWQRAQKAGCTIVDLSFALEDQAGVTLTSPWLQAPNVDLKTTIVSIAHPAATMLALLLRRAASLGVRSAAATLYDPVSERGRRGMDELHQQTLNLLGFQPMPKEEFDAQVAFNLLPRYGSEAKQTVESSELRILKHFADIAPDVARPALQLVQAPTFHGHVASVLLELNKPSGIAEINAALAGEHISIIGGADEPPSNVSIAGLDTIQVWVRQDATRPEAIWVWAAADNLKIAGLTACDAGRALLAARPTGKIQ